MANAQLLLLLAAFIGGIFTVELPDYRFGIALLGVAALLYGPPVRAALCLALASGILDACLQAKGPNWPDQSLQSPALVIDSRPQENGTVTTIALQDHTQAEAWFPLQLAPPLGHAVRLKGEIVPFDEPRNPGAPSARALAAGRGSSWRIMHPVVVRDLGLATADPRTWLPLARQKAHHCLQRYLDPPTLSIVISVLWGDRSGLPPALRDALVATSTIHVVITAGLHVGVIFTMLMLITKGLRIGRSVSALSIAPLLILYACFAGGHFPALRAAVCTSILLLARLCGTSSSSWRCFILALSILVIVEPTAPTRLAFWLSCCCVAALLTFYRPLFNRLTFVPAVLRPGIALSIVAQLGTWPLLAYATHQFSLGATLANLIVVPAIPLLMGCGAILLTIGSVTALCGWALPNIGALPLTLSLGACHAVASSCALLAHGIEAVVVAFARIPHVSELLPDPPLLAIIVSYGALSLAGLVLNDPGSLHLRCAQRSLRWTATHIFAFLLALSQVSPLVGLLLSAQERSLKITMLDVGQGDGIVIETPHHHVILIDTGGQLELHANAQTESSAERAGGNVLLPFLAHEGIRRIDMMVLTHPHGDHVGGAAPILRILPVGVILDSGQAYQGRAYRDAMALALAKHVPIQRAKRGQRIATDDGVQMEILAPFAQPLPKNKNAINEGSIVLRLGFANWHMLFTGDAGMQTEARLLAAGDTLSSDYLKVGHHGSAGASSPAFIAAVHPRLALISVGRHNIFHHPAEATLQTLISKGITVLRTDRCGAITLDPTTAKTMLSCDQSHTFLP